MLFFVATLVSFFLCRVGLLPAWVLYVLYLLFGSSLPMTDSFGFTPLTIQILWAFFQVRFLFAHELSFRNFSFNSKAFYLCVFCKSQSLRLSRIGKGASDVGGPGTAFLTSICISA